MHLTIWEITNSQTLAHNSLFELIALSCVVIVILISSKLPSLLLQTGSFIAPHKKKSMGVRSGDQWAYSIVPHLLIQPPGSIFSIHFFKYKSFEMKLRLYDWINLGIPY